MSYKELQKRKNLTSRILQLQVDRFVSNKNNRIIMPAQPYHAAVNINGFIEVLNGAIRSHDYEMLESIMPKEVDLSIRQNGGFSVFLWLHIPKKKKPKKVQKKDQDNKQNQNLNETKKEEKKKQICYIFKKGGTVDQFTPSIGLSINQEKEEDNIINQSEKKESEIEQNLFIELSTSKSKKETLYANKKIEENHLYSIGISFAINYEDDTTSVSLYIDGKLDTQSSIPGEPIHNQGSVFFGKPDSSTSGFIGTVADVMMVPSVITEQEVSLAHSEGLKNLYDSNGEMLGMNTVFAEIFKRKKLINKYAFYTKKSVYEIENLCLSNAKMLEIVKNYDKEERDNDIRPPPEQIDYKKEKMISEMTEFLSDIDNRILCNKIDINGKLINTCFYLANQGEENLEIDRVINIFNTLSEVLLFSVPKPFIIKLAKILNAYLDVTEKIKELNLVKIKEMYLKTKKFFINLEISLDALDKNEREEEEENAKYLKGKKHANRAIYSSLRRAKPENSDPLPLEETRGFGNCIPEHEVLLLKTQNIKNSIDIEQEENLPQYHSTFIIKTLYEKPKNLPGEDPESPEVRVLSTSMSSEDEEELNNLNNENYIMNESFQNNQNPNNTSSVINQNETRRKQKDIDYNAVNEFVLKIFDEEEKTFKSPEIGSVVDEDAAENIQKAILDAKIEEERKKEEEENKKIAETSDNNKKVDEKKQETNEIIEYPFDPEAPKDWSNGNFELIINHCYDCHKHQNTTKKHYEFRFVDKFNEIGDAVKNTFPNAIIIGNLDKQEYLSNFDVYLRNTGLPCDIKGRYFIYSKRETLKFPTATDILDKLICLSIMYGSSMNVEKAQHEDLRNEMAKSKKCHEYPAPPLEEIAEKIKQKVLAKIPEQKIDPERTKYFCEHHGCNKEFVHNHNGKRSCRYHPGVYQFGSYNGTWPECWTCCEGKWDSPGCKVGPHSEDVLLEKRLMLCVNHGEVNPNTGHPDSACGTWFTERSTEGCKYHSGHLEKGQYTCCGSGEGSSGCVEGEHKTANYPEPEAKLYFYPKLLDNPGLKYEKKEKKEGDDQPKNITAELIKSCGYFKEIVEYPDYKKLDKERKDRIEREKELDRYCFNWGCGKTYKDANNDDNSCKCHPGKWDHGFSGTTTVKFIAMHNENMELWRPHWTCCRGDWNSKPCKRCKHHGPLKTDLRFYDMRYKYPDQRMKLRFKRVVGDKWMAYMEKFVYDEGQVRRICKKFWDGGQKSLSDMPYLCDKLKLNLLVLQEDPSYIMKFWDIVNKNETCAYFSDKEGTVDMDKFIKWWFMEYEDIYNELHPLKKKEDKKDKKEEEKTATAA